MRSRAQRWPFWRKIMLLGAVWLLVVAIVEEGFRSPSSVWGIAAFAVGYGLLAVGFFSAMSERSDRRPPGDDQGS